MWSYPISNEHSEGILWTGTVPPTEADYEGVDNGSGAPLTEEMVDPRTLVGTYHRDWTTAYDEAENTDPKHRGGGLGSPVYEEQKLDDGVRMELGEVFWFKVGEPQDKGVPDGHYGKGVVHDVTNVEYAEVEIHYGPEPGSAAEKQLAGETVVWDETHQYWNLASVVEAATDPATYCPHCGGKLT